MVWTLETLTQFSLKKRNGGVQVGVGVGVTGGWEGDSKRPDAGVK